MRNEKEMYALALKLARVKSEQNILAALAIYHHEAVIEAPGFDSVANGAAEIEQQLSVFFHLFPDYSVELKQYAIRRDVMLSTGKVFVTLNVPEKKCPRIELPVFIEFHFKGQHIIKEVFFLDAGMVCRKSGVAVEKIAEAMRLYRTGCNESLNTQIREIRYEEHNN